MSLPTLSIHVVFLARYAELVGADRRVVTVPAGSRVADAVRAVRATTGGDTLPARLFVARNLEQVTEDVPLADGDELALLPPMSGG